MRVVAGETLAVSLPGFTGPERSCIQAVSPFGIFSRASWSAMDNKLKFTATSDLQPFSAASALIPWYIGVRLPASGLTENQVDLLVETTAAAGQVLPTRITKSPSVGLFRKQPAASFGGVQAGSVARINISWVLNLPVAPMSTFEITFNNFTFAESVLPRPYPVVLGGLTGNRFTASIDDAGNNGVKLIMQAVALVGRNISINATEPVTVVIPASAGVRR